MEPAGTFPSSPPKSERWESASSLHILTGNLHYSFFFNLFLKKVLLHLFNILMICMEKLKIEIFLNSSDYCQEYDFQNEFSQVAKLLYG